MSAKTIQELEENTRLMVESVMLSDDSELSKNRQVFNAIGYHQGYCDAKGWERNISFEIALVDLLK